MTDTIPDRAPKPEMSAENIGIIAEFMEGARVIKATFDAYVEAGFTSEQSMRLVCELIRGAKS